VRTDADDAGLVEARHFGALSLLFCRRDDASVVVEAYLATLLVDIAVLAPQTLRWDFDADAGGASARGELWMAIGTPGFFSTIHGNLDYTASGTWNHYRGLLSHWEPTSVPQASADPLAEKSTDAAAAVQVSVLAQRRRHRIGKPAI
jgi:hypothetical protein